MNNPILIKRGTLLSVIDNILDPNEQVLWRDKPAKKPVKKAKKKPAKKPAKKSAVKRLVKKVKGLRRR